MAGAELTVLREIAEGAKVHPTARVGEFCTIGPGAVIGPGTVLARRVTVTGRTAIGAANVIGDGSVLGAVPQDLKYGGGETWLIIGDGNRLGPNVTAHVGTEAGGHLTRLGNGNVLAAGVHVAHDCYVDDAARLGAGVLLAGHVRVETGAVIEELTGANDFTTFGQYSRVGSRTPVRRDVPPFTFVSSRGYYTAPPAVVGVNEEGLERAGLGEREKDLVRRAIRHLFQDEQALQLKLQEMLAGEALCEPVRALCEFCQATLAGQFGRRRETLRGTIPPEARQFLPAEVLGRIEGGSDE